MLLSAEKNPISAVRKTTTGRVKEIVLGSLFKTTNRENVR